MNTYDMYSCDRCANKGTPICKVCTHITSPQGVVRKPKYYVFTIDIATLPSAIEERQRAISRYLNAGLPVPIRLVMEYNKFVEKTFEEV